MKKLFLVLLILLCSACASVKKVEPGTHKVGERLSVNIEGMWNHLDFPGIKPAEVWTMEGLTIDELLIYADIRDGQTLHPDSGGPGKQAFVFRSNMEIEAVVALFEGVLTRDGSTFKLLKLEPYSFGGQKGYRFEYERIRKVDNVQLRGVGFGAVAQGKLYALLYHAPRLTFFPRHQAQVESIARNVVIN